MGKINRKTMWMAAAAMAGSMAVMSGCGTADQPAADQPESVVIQKESSAAVPESTAGEPQSTQTEIETESVTETEIETEIETETDTEAAAQTETQTESEKETETKAEVSPESQVEAEAESKPQEQAPEVQEAAPAVEGSVSDSDFAAVVKGVIIPLKGDMAAYTAQLGEPDAYGSAKSCTEAGDDKVYTYGGVVIYTYITNGVDVISLIELTGSESLPSGIHVGSTKADVVAAYGSAYTEEGTELLYEMGGKTIGLQMSGDTVSFIEMF